VLSFSSNRRNWDSPNPSPAGECAPPPPVLGGGEHSLAREGLGESQFRRGDRHCGSLYVFVLCAANRGNKLWKIYRKLVLIAIPIAIRVTRYCMLTYLFCSHILFVCLHLVEVYIKRNYFSAHEVNFAAIAEI
jgi:hypothetical protein